MAILGGLGLAFAALIAAANKKLKVWEDPRIDAVVGLLPGANCGACGSPGCRAFAERLVGGGAKPSTCTVSSPSGVDAIATYLGVDAGEAEKRVARLLCAGGTDVAVQQARYRGFASCVAAAAVAGGGKGCTWGCLGLADCAEACAFDAIHMSVTGLPVVTPAACTACGDCVRACPKDLFTVLPQARRLLVQCRSLLAGDGVQALCRVGCTGCGICVTDARTPGLLHVEHGLALVDPSVAESEDDSKAVARCPTGAIVWLEGPAQFARSGRAGARSALRSEKETVPS